MSRNKRYPAELKERAVRMVAEAVEGGETEWAAMRRIAELLGVGGQVPWSGVAAGSFGRVVRR